MGSKLCSMFCPTKSAKSTRHINDLPDLCLRLIFSHLPLVDLLRIGQVCLYWKCLQGSVCATKRDVVIFIGDRAPMLVKVSEFKIPFADRVITDELNQIASLSDASLEANRIDFAHPNFVYAKLVTSLIPNITSLTIVFDNNSSKWKQPEKGYYKDSKEMGINQIIYLIKFWSSNLKTLKLYSNLCEEYNEFNRIDQTTPVLNRLISLINTCPMLDHLTVEIDSRFYYQIENKNWPIVSRLSEFYFSFYGLYYEHHGLYGLELDSFTKNAAQNPKLRTIGFNGFNVENVKKMLLKNVDQNLYEKFCFLPEITLTQCEPNFPLNDFCARFFNLQSVSISFGLNIAKFYKVAHSLKMLSKLIYLNIDMNSEDNSDVLQNDSTSIPQLSSVKILKISVGSHEDLNLIKWNEIFPNLEIVHFNDDICIIICYKEYRDQDEHNYKSYEEWFTKQRIADCVRLKAQPFKKCSKLHSIYTGSLYDRLEQWPLSDLL